MRCFVAAFVAAGSATGLQEIYRTLPGDRAGLPPLRDVPSANYHVTLKFLGEVPESRVPGLLAAVAELGGHPLIATALRLMALPRPERPRLLAAELAPQPELTRWRALLEQRLGAGERGFRPHVTLARARNGGRRQAAFEPWLIDPAVEVELLAPALYRSDRTAEGARYRQVTAADVSGGCGP